MQYRAGMNIDSKIDTHNVKYEYTIKKLFKILLLQLFVL